MRMRRVLVCSYALPSPDHDSGSRRLMDFIEFLLEEGWRVEFFALKPVTKFQAASLTRIGILVHDIACFEELSRKGSFDLVLAAFWPVAQLVLPIVRRVSPATPVIVDSVDLHYLRIARRLLSPERKTGAELLGEDYGSQMVSELNCYAAADTILTVSEKETAGLRDLIGDRTPIVCVPDNEELLQSTESFQQRRGVLTLGSYNHAPNVQAVEFLCRDVLPLVNPKTLEEHPVYVVGSGLDERVRSYGRGVPNVHMVGWVPSVAEYFVHSRVSVVPLLYGAGTKRKLVQALMTGTPTVTTSIGAEGLDVTDEKDVLVADSPTKFATSIERLLTDEVLWAELSKNGRQVVLDTHCRRTAKSRFLSAVESVLRSPTKPAMIPELGLGRYQECVNYQYNLDMRDLVWDTVLSIPEAAAKIVVAGLGMSRLTKIGQHEIFVLADREGEHENPPAIRESVLIQGLQECCSNGALYLIIPESCYWWLDHLPELRAHLKTRLPKPEARKKCLIYALSSYQPDTHVVSKCVDDVRIVAQDSDSSSAAFAGVSVTTRLIAFYLPQFHPIPENDAWWGEGFTEWTNVSKAKPLFKGHYQPHLPTDLGYYDLRLEETRVEQAEMARRYGIHGFCYYHYWFNGKQLLERPFNEVLKSGEPDFPFCLCWANEPWSRRWDGRPTDVLQPQTYSAEDDLAHIRWLIPALADPRAIQIDGKPLLLIYQGRELPEPQRTVDQWREEIETAGLPGLYLMAVETGWDAGWDATQVGFDAKVLFQPQFSMLAEIPRLNEGGSRLRIFDYQQAWPTLANPQQVSYPRYDTVFPMWDNTARKGEDGWVLHNASPEAYEQWLQLAIERASDRPRDQQVVFINAWNEWAEGCHLEPDRKFGLAFLEATRRALVHAPLLDQAR